MYILLGHRTCVCVCVRVRVLVRVRVRVRVRACVCRTPPRWTTRQPTVYGAAAALEPRLWHRCIYSSGSSSHGEYLHGGENA